MRLVDGALQNLGLAGIFTADIYKAGVGPDRVAAQGASFDELVGVAFDQYPIFECSRLRFIGVAHQVLLLIRVLRDKAPLDPSGEACASAAA